MKVLNVEPDRYTEAVRHKLALAGDVDYRSVDGQPGLVAALKGREYEALFVRLGLSVDAEVLAAAPGLKWVVTPTTGQDHLDVELLRSRGIGLISLKGEAQLLDGITSTAEHTWALLLAALRHVPAAHQDVLEGHWRREPFLGQELAGLTLGVVGYGRLGRMVASYGLAFRMRVLIHDISPAALARAVPGLEAVDADAVVRQSDVLSLHLPLEADTRGWLSRERVGQMKTGAVLVNTARGEVIDDAAVLDALEGGKLSRAAVDVLSGDSRWESAVSTDPVTARWLSLARAGRALVTPHIGGYGASALNRTRDHVVSRFLEKAGVAGKEQK